MSSENAWSKQELIDKLSRRKFGEHLARRVVTQLKIDDHNRGGLYHDHRDYCGHGIVYRDGTFMLLRVIEGWIERSDTLATWDDEEAFVAFLADQSDFSCSGGDSEAKLFYTDDEFELNNQRINESWMEEYAAGNGPFRLPTGSV